MLWKLIIPAIDAGYDDLADILALVSLVINVAADYYSELHNDAMLRGCSIEEMLTVE